jgi:hypothetical protein
MPSDADNYDALGRLAIEFKRYNDRFDPIPFWRRPIGYGIVGLILMLIGGTANPQFAIAGALLFVAQAIASRSPH